MKPVRYALLAVLIFAAVLTSCEQPDEPPPTYTVHYDANGGSGKMADSVFACGVWHTLPPNTFTREGYVFGGWQDSKGVPNADGKIYSQSTDPKTLYAVWIGTYTIRYDANGGIGEMEDSVHAMRDGEKLRDNAFTREEYAFTGWAESPDDMPASPYRDGMGLDDFYTSREAETTVTLYAVWKAGAYTVKFVGNGGVKYERTYGGNTLTITETNATFIHDEEQILQINSFTRLSYVFDGWATSPNGPVEYTDTQSIVNLAPIGQSISLYAVWRGTYGVRYEGNGASYYSSMAGSTFTIDEPQNLPPNTHYRPYYTFMGWAETANGPVVYFDGQSVVNLTQTAGKYINLYAVWAMHPNVYIVVCAANGGSGSSLESFFDVDRPKNIPANTFTRANYTFMGWAETADGPVVYADGQSVVNLPFNEYRRKVLYAVWANNYTVFFNNNGGSGSASGQSFTYGVEQSLRTNTFSRVGYTFAGWATSSNGAVVYHDGESVTDLTETAGGHINLYAVWDTSATAYTVTYNANDGSGRTVSAVFLLGVSQYLRENSYTRAGYTFTGWATSPDGTAVYNNRQSVTNLADTAGATVNLYAAWKANAYTVVFNNNGGSGTMSDQSFTYDEAQNLRANDFTPRPNSFFAGWATSANGAAAYYNGQSVANLAAADGATVDLYAVWANDYYTVVFNANGGSGTMSGQDITYNTSQSLKVNAFVRTNYIFAGWATSTSGAVVYTNRQYVSDLVSPPQTEITLYARWTPTYTVAYNGNGAATGNIDSQTFTYGVADSLRLNIFRRTLYTFEGWAISRTGEVKYRDGETVNNLTSVAGETYTLYAVWHYDGLPDPPPPPPSGTYTVVYNANGGSGSMADSTLIIGQKGNLRPLGFTRSNYRFVHWSTSNNNVTYGDQESVTNLTTTAGATVTLNAEWSNTWILGFVPNGGSGYMPQLNNIYGQTIQLPPNNYTRAGYTFVGWGLDGSSNVIYADGETIGRGPSTTRVTLNAIWEPN